MRLLLDENIPHRFRYLLPGHEVETASYRGWKAVRNGDLLRAAAEAEFEVIITVDAGLAEAWKRGQPPLSIILLESTVEPVRASSTARARRIAVVAPLATSIGDLHS
jgi:predicted nuclease of predicted toxin-antitoxin system